MPRGPDRSRTSPARVLPAALALAALTGASAPGCTLTTDLDGYAATVVPDAATAAPADASGVDAPPEQRPDAEAGTPAVVRTSCLAHKEAEPGSSDGTYLVDPDDEGPLPARSVRCDMTADGGGWMLVTLDQAATDDGEGYTVDRSVDANGGVVARVFANGDACGEPGVRVRHRLGLTVPGQWKSVRARYTFAGRVSCWTAFGGRAAAVPLAPPNLIPFDRNVDIAREAILMGGADGAFDGAVSRCDEANVNFWFANEGQHRSVVVILRRDRLDQPSGLATWAECLEPGPGKTSPTWWQYAEIHVR